MTKKKKMKFEVQENESIDQCLRRMDKEGYQPVRRMEEPLFEEVKLNGKVEIKPVGRKIIFEGKLL